MGLALANGVASGTTDPTLSGTIVSGLSLGGITLEFDFTGDGVPDQFAQTDAFGRYSLTPTGLPFGTVNVQARARETDPVSGVVQTSSWTSYSFTYNQPTNAAPVRTTTRFVRSPWRITLAARSIASSAVPCAVA